MKEKLVLVSTEEGRHCDIFPPHSVHLATEENNGAYKVPVQNNNYLNMDWVENHNYYGQFGDKCKGCNNVFTLDVKLIDDRCPRCIDRKTRVN